MSWGFEKGRVYNRRNDIHARFKGQEQGGIITPAEHAVVIIITGEEGLEHGYHDRSKPDGTFEYFGEGQVGGMTLNKGNKAIAEHSSNGKSLLLFRKTKEGLRFEDEMVYEAHHIEQAPDRTGSQRNALVFELRSLEGVAEKVEAEAVPATGIPHDIAELLKRALTAANNEPAGPTEGKRNVYQRSRDVRVYVLARAAGHCEGCTLPAPFQRKDGTPYLEPHHIRRLSDGGPDHPASVISLCPTCHRRVHAGADGADYNSQLMTKMETIQPER